MTTTAHPAVAVDASAVARAAAVLVPSSVPLTAVPCSAGDVPTDVDAVVATFAEKVGG